jgi:hypothetical protein
MPNSSPSCSFSSASVAPLVWSFFHRPSAPATVCSARRSPSSSVSAGSRGSGSGYTSGTGIPNTRRTAASSSSPERVAEERNRSGVPYQKPGSFDSRPGW